MILDTGQPKKEKSRLRLGVEDSSFSATDVGTHYLNSGKKTEKSQSDVASEVANKFQPKKELSVLLSESYYRLNQNLDFSFLDYYKKGSRVSSCGSILQFRQGFDTNTGVLVGDKKLHRADFCHDRLCPMCSWRRSYKIFGQMSSIMEYLQGQNYSFLFLTLTVPNSPYDSLAESVDSLSEGFARFVRSKKFRGVVLGYCRVLEITYNSVSDSWHPHYHVVLAVGPSYFTRDYIKRDEWLDMWRKAMRDDSITQVDVRKVKGDSSADLSKAVAEVAKYAVKSSDYIFKDNEVLTDRLVFALSSVLHGRRLIQYSGIFKEAYKALNCEDIESDNVDLVHLEKDKINPELSYMIISFGWSVGAYKLVDQRIIKGSDLLEV